MTKKALVLGATGLVGRHSLRYLLDSNAYQHVTVLSRRPLDIEHPRLTVKEGDLADLTPWAEQFAVDDVFCCLGTTMDKAGSRQAFRHVDHDLVLSAGQLAKRAGVQRFLVVSAVNARAHSPFFYARVKGQMERDLIKLKLPLLAIFQPSLLKGERDHKRPAEDWGNLAGRVLHPLTRWTNAHWLPVEAETVGMAMAGMALLGPQTGLYKLRYRDFLEFAGQYREAFA